MKVHKFHIFRWTTGAAVLMTLALMWVISACSPVQSPASAAAANAVIPNTGAQPTATSAAMPTAQTTTAPSGNPKAYIGLFKDNAVAVLDTVTNSVVKTVAVPTGPHGLVMTHDGRWVYVSSDGDSKVSLIDTQSDTIVKTIEVGKAPHGLAMTPDGSMVLVAVFGTSQVVWIDTSSNAVVGQVSVPSPHNIAVSPDGHTAYVASQKMGSTGLAVIDLDSKTQKSFIPLDKTPRALNFSPDGKQLLFTLAGVNAVQVLDPTSNKVNAAIDVGASPHLPIYAPDGKMALVVSQGPGELYFMDTQTNVAFLSLTVGQMPHWIALNPQGTRAWVTNENSNSVSVVDLKKFNVTATIPVGNGPRKIVVQPGAGNMTQDPPAAQATNQVVITGMAFSPNAITVHAGQVITWTNQDSVDHSITDDRSAWDSGPVSPGKSYTLTLSTPGQYTYHCAIHTFMTGSITVIQ